MDNVIMDAIFGDLTSDQILKSNEQKKESDFYRPKLSEKGSYEAVLKFIPNIFDINQSIINKWAVYLENPDTDEKRMVDCPSTIKGNKSILQDIYFALKNSQNAQENALKDNFSRKQQFFSLIQIVKDKQHPELEGKIKIWQYGQQVYEIIEKLMRPKTEDRVANNPFKLFTGYSFELLIEKQGNGYPKYTNSSFLNRVHLLKIDGEEIGNDPKNAQKITEFIGDWPTKLMNCAFKPWDEDTKDFVVRTIRDVVPNHKLIEQVFKKNDVISSSPIKAVSTIEVDRTSSIKKSNNKHKEQLKTHIDEDDIYEDPLDDEVDEIDAFLENTKKNAKISKPTTKTSTKEEDDDFFD